MVLVAEVQLSLGDLEVGVRHEEALPFQVDQVADLVGDFDNLQVDQVADLVGVFDNLQVPEACLLEVA